MDLPVCPNCESVDWSIRAEITVAGYVRRRDGAPTSVDVYADLDPSRFDIAHPWDPDDPRKQFFCTNCGHDLEASPTANPPLLKESFNEAFAGTVGLHLRDDAGRVQRSLGDPDDHDAWPQVYRIDAGLE